MGMKQVCTRCNNTIQTGEIKIICSSCRKLLQKKNSYGIIPTWDECHELVNAIGNGLPETLDPIQQMILNNEPSNPNHAEGFRDDLQKVINYMEEI